MERPQERLRPAHAPDRKQHAGVGLARAHLAAAPGIGVVGEVREERRPPPIVRVRHLPIRPARAVRPSPLQSRTRDVRAHRSRPSPRRPRARPRRTRASASRSAARSCASGSSGPAARSPARAPWFHVALLPGADRRCQRRRPSIAPTRAAAKTGRSHPACSRHTPACGHRATGSGKRRWCRRPRGATSDGCDIGDEDAKAVAVAVGGKSRRPSGSHAGDTLRLPCDDATVRTIRPLAGSTSTISDRPASDTRSAARGATVGRPPRRREVDAGLGHERTTGCATRPDVAGSGSVASSRRSSRWIVQTITRPSGDTSGSPARAPWVKRSGPPPAVHHVEIPTAARPGARSPSDRTQRGAGEPDARAEVAVRHLREASAPGAREERRKAVRVDDRE